MENKKNKKNKKKKVAVAAPMILLFICIGFFSVRMLSDDSDLQKGSLTLSTNNTQENLNKKADEAGFIVTMNTNIIVDGKKTNLMIENTEENKDNCQVDIYDENDQLLYESEVIAPGYFIEDAKLQSDLEEGTHDGHAVFSILNDKG